MAILGEPALISDILDPLGPHGDTVISEAIVPVSYTHLTLPTSDLV